VSCEKMWGPLWRKVLRLIGGGRGIPQASGKWKKALSGGDLSEKNLLGRWKGKRKKGIPTLISEEGRSKERVKLHPGGFFGGGLQKDSQFYRDKRKKTEGSRALCRVKKKTHGPKRTPYARGLEKNGEGNSLRFRGAGL